MTCEPTGRGAGVDAVGETWAAETAERVVWAVRDFGIDNTGAENAATDVQAMFDGEQGLTTFVFEPGSYRFDTGVTLSKPGCRIVGFSKPGIPKSGDTPFNATGWTVGATQWLSDRPIDILTIDVGAPGGDWRGAWVQGIVFGDYYDSGTGSHANEHDMVDACIRVVRGMGVYVVDCAATRIQKPTGKFIHLAPSVSSAVQYFVALRCGTDFVHGSAISANDNLVADGYVIDCLFYGSDQVVGPPPGSVAINAENWNDLQLRGGSLQFWETMVYFDGDFQRALFVNMEQSSEYARRGDSFIHWGPNARWGGWDQNTFANLSKNDDVVRIDAGASEIVEGINYVNSIKRSTITSDAGTRTRSAHPEPVATGANITLHGGHHLVEITGSQTTFLPPAALAEGRLYLLWVISGTSTVVPHGSETIDGSRTRKYRSPVFLYSDGTRWRSK